LQLERKKRSRLEVIFDILYAVHNSGQGIKITPLIRKSNLSPQSFSSYYVKLLEKGFIKEVSDEKEKKLVVLTEKGVNYIREYKTVLIFIQEFEL
jgi:predicted transcriptional regulator